jgi:hypothetical protein
VRYRSDAEPPMQVVCHCEPSEITASPAPLVGVSFIGYGLVSTLWEEYRHEDALCDSVGRP